MPNIEYELNEKIHAIIINPYLTWEDFCANCDLIKKYNIIFVALILSVFIHIRYETQLVIIRPFDFIAVITFLYLIFKKEEVKEKIETHASHYMDSWDLNDNE